MGLVLDHGRVDARRRRQVAVELLRCVKGCLGHQLLRRVGERPLAALQRDLVEQKRRAQQDDARDDERAVGVDHLRRAARKDDGAHHHLGEKGQGGEAEGSVFEWGVGPSLGLGCPGR